MNTRPANIGGTTPDSDRGELRTVLTLVDRMSVQLAEASTRIDQAERRADEANHRADTANARAGTMDRPGFHRANRAYCVGLTSAM